MRKVFSIILATLLLLSACSTASPSASTTPPGSDSPLWSGEPMGKSISLDSAQALAQMRSMAVSSDEAVVSAYLSEVGTEITQEDLKSFLRLLDSLPIVNILDGEVTWISLSSAISQDTGKNTTVLYITTKADSGDWVRLEYLLSATELTAASDSAATVFPNPIVSNDNRITVYNELRKDHPTKPGKMILWEMKIDEIYLYVQYYTQVSDAVNISELIPTLSISSADEIA